jgi:hypothetical protein
LRLELPGVGLSRSLPTVTASGARAQVGIQARAGADGVIHLFLTGIGEDDEWVQLVGGTGQSVAGSSTPMLVYVLPDGVHVYERIG